MPKEKLTLSVDSEVVEKAKSLGLNISEITEVALRGFSFSAKEADPNALYGSYKALSDAMKPLLSTYDASVKIASEEITDEKTGNSLGLEDSIFLCSDGTLYSDTFETTFTDIAKIPTYAFCTPKEILSNLVDALAKSVAHRKETIKELEMARRIVDAIASTMQEDTGPKTRVGKRERSRKGSHHQKTKTVARDRTM